MAGGLFGLGTNISSSELLILIGALLIIAGIILAFRGRRIWAGLMGLIGAIIGGSLGFLFGALLNSWIAALILSMVGAFIGSVVFGYIVKIALAFVTALLVAGGFYVWAGPEMSQDTRMILSIVILLVVYTIAYWFIQEIIAFVTALLGGILIGIGIYLIWPSEGTLAFALGVLAFIVGFVVQTIDYRASKRRPVQRVVTQQYYYQQQPAYVPEPAPEPAPEPVSPAEPDVSEPPPPPPPGE